MFVCPRSLGWYQIEEICVMVGSYFLLFCVSESHYVLFFTSWLDVCVRKLCSFLERWFFWGSFFNSAPWSQLRMALFVKNTVASRTIISGSSLPWQPKAQHCNEYRLCLVTVNTFPTAKLVTKVMGVWTSYRMESGLSPYLSRKYSTNPDDDQDVKDSGSNYGAHA